MFTSGLEQGTSKNDALVSVVIPVYNGSTYIERTLKSVSDQTYRRLEIILVNDGSTDDTSSVVNAYAATEARLRVITTLNGGVARARNTGISSAEGELVAFVDADDIWHPKKIAEQVRAMTGTEGSRFGASYVLHRIIDQDDQVLHAACSSVYSGSLLARHFTGKFVGNGSSLMVRRSAIVDVGGFDPSYADAGIGGCEDLDSELRILAKYQMVGIPAYLVGYRKYPGNMSSNHLRMAKSVVETVERHLALHPELPASVHRYARASTHAWTAENLFAGKYLKAATEAVIHVFRNDAGAGLQVIKMIFRRTLQKLLKSAGLKSSAAKHLPRFQDLSPLTGLGETPASALTTKWIELLEPADLARASFVSNHEWAKEKHLIDNRKMSIGTII